MSYDISLYDRDFLENALAEGLGDWTGAPPISAIALDELRLMLSAEGFACEQNAAEEWVIGTDAVFAQVSIFPGQVAFTIPYSAKASESIRLCERIARAVSTKHGLGYDDPQSSSPEEDEALLRSALADLEDADPQRQRFALDRLQSLTPTQEIADAVIQKLAGGSDVVRPAAAESLAAIFSETPELASEAAISSLGRALSDPLVPTRTFAANALAALGGRAATVQKALERALDDESYGPRGYAKLALEAIAKAQRT